MESNLSCHWNSNESRQSDTLTFLQDLQGWGLLIQFPTFLNFLYFFITMERQFLLHHHNIILTLHASRFHWTFWLMSFEKRCIINNGRRSCVENVLRFIVSNVSADGLAPLSAVTSADTIMTMYTQSIFDRCHLNISFNGSYRYILNPQNISWAIITDSKKMMQNRQKLFYASPNVWQIFTLL